MKAIMIVILLLLLPGGICDSLQEEALSSDTPLSVDIDGNGSMDTISWTMIPDEWEQHLQVTVNDSITFDTDIYSSESVYVVDLNNDGIQEILLTGDVMSSDYYTWCLHLRDDHLYEVLFPDSTRSDAATQAYYKSGYGQITAIDGNNITLTGSQDMLGTWFASRTVSLEDSGLFEFSDDGRWVRESINDETWEYGALTTLIDLPYKNESDVDMTLPAGSRIVITATDKENYAWFVTEDGREGNLSVQKDYARGFGSLVGNVPEDECFEYVPYAD